MPPPRRRGLSLAIQIFLAAAALLAGTLGIAITLANRRAQTVAEETIREHLSAVPALWSGYVGSRADAGRRQLRSLAAEPGTKALMADAGHDSATLHDTAVGFSRGLGASVMFLFDPRGLLLERTDREPGEERGRDFSDVSWVAAPLKEGATASAFILDATRARMVHLVASAPVVQGQGSDRMLSGVVAAAFPMNHERLGEFARIAGAETAVIANLAPRNAPRQVEVLASTPAFNGQQLLTRVPGAEAVLDAVFGRGETAGPLELGLGSEAFIGSVLPLQSGSGETIAGIVVARSKSAEMAAFNAIRRSLVLVGTGLLVAALPVSFFLARRLANPIRQLASAASRVASGELDVSLPAARGGEVGALSEAFGTMVTELKEKTQLEALVAEMRNRPSEATLSDIRADDLGEGEEILEPGRVFAGRYEVRSLLGEGSMGKVFRVRDRELDEEVALKALKPKLPTIQGTDGVEALRQEIKLARMVTHPNVVRVHDFGEALGVRYFTMEYVAGTTLYDFLERGGPLAIIPALQIAKQICRGLSAVHKAGVVHGDMKPQNVIVGAAGVVKLMDFGVARARLALNEGGPVVAGTPLYMSPEQAGGMPVDASSDLYSAGAVLYEVFTGRPPFMAANILTVLSMHIHEPPPDPRKLRPDIPDLVARTLISCLDKSAVNRPKNAAELERLLTRVRARV